MNCIWPKRLLVKALCSRAIGTLLLTIGQKEIRRHQCRIFIDDVALDPSIVATLFWGLYERSELRLARLIRRDLDVVELLGREPAEDL